MDKGIDVTLKGTSHQEGYQIEFLLARLTDYVTPVILHDEWKRDKHDRVTGRTVRAALVLSSATLARMQQEKEQDRLRDLQLEASHSGLL